MKTKSKFWIHRKDPDPTFKVDFLKTFNGVLNFENHIAKRKQMQFESSLNAHKMQEAEAKHLNKIVAKLPGKVNAYVQAMT